VRAPFIRFVDADPGGARIGPGVPRSCHRALTCVRLADAQAGLWEAADLQWWWRTPRGSDVVDQLFWMDDEGPVAAAVLTEWSHGWGCDPIVVQGSSVQLSTVARTLYLGVGFRPGATRTTFTWRRR
jgi:hypothetical protein